MKVIPDEKKSLITCKHYDREIAIEFNDYADADDMITIIRNLLRFMAFEEKDIDYIMGVDNVCADFPPKAKPVAKPVPRPRRLPKSKPF